ncbi:hypothetical protein [Streptomyces sp. PA5.6]|uniref:hypothetical protein n=1 Tax=Streptomyces sp. PA5.6 TaxID=3035651 RepID=UPI0039049E20
MPRHLITCVACGEQAVPKARGWWDLVLPPLAALRQAARWPPPRKGAVCGTTGGYEQHKRLRTKVCDGCPGGARNSAERRRKRRKRDTTGKERYYTTATPRADWSKEQQRAARLTALVSSGRDDRLLLLQARGPAEPDEAAPAATA